MATKTETKPAAELAAPPAIEAENSALDERDEAAAMACLKRVEGKELQLHAKLADIQRIVDRIPKRGRAPQAMGGFPFVQVGDAADVIRRALGRRNVSMTPTGVEKINHSEHLTKNNAVMTTVELMTTWTLTDGDTGESTTIMSYGAGADTGDKFSGKVMSNAMKYALVGGFMLSTGDDVELSDTSDKVGTAAPARVERSAGRVPAQGGKQADQSKPQRQVIGELLRKLGATTADRAAALVTELTGKTIELGEDKPAGLQKALDAFTSNESGKLVHDLRLRAEAKDAPAKEPTEEPAAGAESSPGAVAGDEPDESLEAGSAL